MASPSATTPPSRPRSSLPNARTLSCIPFVSPIRSSSTCPFEPLVWRLPANAGKRGLARMARETGGISFEVPKGLTIDAIYAQIEEALRNQYSIGYTPERTTDRAGGPKGTYHTIKLITKDRSLTVNARAGYYAR